MEAVLSTLSFYRVHNSDCITLSLYDQPALSNTEDVMADFVGKEFHLNEYLLPSASSTYLVRVNDESMHEANVPKGALLLVDRTRAAVNNSIVIAKLDNSFVVRTYIVNSSGVRLMPASSKFQPIPVTDDHQFQVWGVVTRVIIDTIR